MSNINSYISQHNKSVLGEGLSYDNPPKGVQNCSCPANKKDSCPLDGRCLDINIIYQAEVNNLQDNSTETYAGLMATTFKSRLAIHKKSFTDRNYNQTALSKHLWKLKHGNISYNIK